MKAADFRRGMKWALRERRTLGTPATPVQLLQWADRKPPRVQVKHLQGSLSGLEEWVTPASLVCPWREWPRRLHFEELEIALSEATPVSDRDVVLAEAAETVFVASGELSVFVEERRGYTRRLDPDALGRLASRAGWAEDERPWMVRPSFHHDGLCYVENRHLVSLARDFARANPEVVTLYISTEEADWLSKGFAGSPFHHKWLLEQGPRHAIARDWAGGAAHDYLVEEVKHLRQLLYRALNELRKNDLGKPADLIEQAMERGR